MIRWIGFFALGALATTGGLPQDSRLDAVIKTKCSSSPPCSEATEGDPGDFLLLIPRGHSGTRPTRWSSFHLARWKLAVLLSLAGLSRRLIEAKTRLPP